MSDVSARVERVLHRLNQLRSSHPNLVSVWHTHIRTRMEKLEVELTRCEEVMESMERREDLPLPVLRDLSVLVTLFCNNNT